MDPEPARASTSITSAEATPKASRQSELSDRESEDPFSLCGPTIALSGLIIAVISVGIPFAAVLTDRPSGGPSFVPTALEGDGPSNTSPISFTRTGQSGGGNPSGEQKQIRILR